MFKGLSVIATNRVRREGSEGKKKLPFDSKTGREDFLYSASATIPLETIRFASGVNYIWSTIVNDNVQPSTKVGGSSVHP